MHTKCYTFLSLMFLFVLMGCQTATPPPKAKNETYQDVGTAVESMAEAISGQELTQDDLRKLNQQIKNDPEAKSAIEAITQSAGGAQTIIKYCPKTGKRYSADIQICPEHGINLEILQ